MVETYELEKIIEELYKLEEMLGRTDSFIIDRSLLESKVHDIVFRLKIWKENNYDKLRDLLNRWNTAKELIDGEMSEMDLLEQEFKKILGDFR
jgi:hypothetical protein